MCLWKGVFSNDKNVIRPDELLLSRISKRKVITVEISQKYFLYSITQD